MKKIFKIFLLTSIFAIVGSCTNEKTAFASANGLSAKTDVAQAIPAVLTDATKANIYTKIDWLAANNGGPSESSYVLQITDIIADPEFKKPIDYLGLSAPTALSAIVTVKEMNDMLLKIPTFKCSEMTIGVRIQSTFGSNPINAIVQNSNILIYKVTGYSQPVPLLAFSNASINLVSAGKLKSTAFGENSDYEGYFYLQAGNYNFYKPNLCNEFTNATAYGGSPTTLSVGGASIVIANTGYYLIKANLVANTYSIKEYKTFGVFGGATRTIAIANGVPMDDVGNKNIWKLTVDLIDGKAFGFKSNLWTGAITIPGPVGTPPVTYPPYYSSTIANTVSILGKTAVLLALEETTLTAANITAGGVFVDNATRKKYDIVLDVSKPRNYTYTITQIN